jgi:mono/diheme cytochrome c family protein
MKKVILSVVFTLIVLVLGSLAYIYSGKFDATQLKPHKPLTEWIIGKTLQHSIGKAVKGIMAPADLKDSSMISLGFTHYNEMCVVCHGAPGIDPSDITEGLYPKPPRFYKSEDMPKPEGAFWIIKNGIKMTSMPALAPTHTDKEIWAVTSFMINKMNSMSPSDYQEWIKKYPAKE